MRTRAPGEHSRRRVLEHAAALATIEGLNGLSIGRLADAIGKPKSSVYVVFGSKQDLQLATIDAARTSFIAEVINRALAATPPGRTQLLALCEEFLSYVDRRVFPGGYFFVAASAELGGQRGPVHDRVALYQQQWRELLHQTAGDTDAAGELPAGVDPEQLAFELSTILAGTNIIAVLHSDNGAIERARLAIRRRLHAAPIEHPAP
jgi:AcrR family transcriptional regulator